MSASSDWALVTGASTGLGADMARVLAARGIPLIVSARSEGRLQGLAEELRDRHGAGVRILPFDLAAPGAGAELAREVTALDLPVGFLVNNAGFGQWGPYPSLYPAGEEAMLRLNVEALTALTRGLLGPMVERRRGRILNVASVASFFPGPYMTSYYATKAYVLSYSEALDEELRGSGVRVSCLCPGPTRTEFQDRASMELSGAMRHTMMESLPVARAGIDAMLRGKRLVVPGFMNKVNTFAPRFLPRALMPKLVGMVQAARKPGRQG